MKHRCLAMVLVLIMSIGMISGCGNSETGGKTQSVTESSHEKDVVQTTDSQSQEMPDDDDDNVTITAKILNNTVSAAAAERILGRLNELTEEKIGVQVNAEFIEFGSWNQTINLMISGNEPVDVISLSPMLTIDMLEKQNALMDITELVDEYAPDTKELVSKVIASTSKDGRIYGIPKLSDQDQVRTIFMRKDILEEMGMLEKASQINSWSGLEELLMAVKAQYPDMVPLYVAYNAGSTPAGAGDDNAADLFSDNSNLDNLSDSYKFVYADPKTGEIGSLYESDMYETMIARISDWYQKGLVYKDGAVTDDDCTTAMSAGNVFCYYGQGKSDPIVAAQEMQGWTGQELVTLQLYHLQALTTNINMFGFAVPYTSKEPEAAVKFINLLMTDPEVTNLLSYGEEGVDYVLENGVAKYPDGVDANNVGYHSQSFLFGNELGAYPWDGTTPEIVDAAMNYYLNEMEVPMYFGFVADVDDLTTEITACYNATLEFRPILECGSATDWKATLEEFRQKLRDCGIDKIIESYRKQAALFLENK